MQIVEQLLLGLSLASAAGLRAFLPLLVLAVAAHFGYVHLNDHFAWLGSNAALLTLAVAAVAEFLADKVPVVDHALDALQTVIRPVAGALAVAGTQSRFDPVMAGILGIILGAPLAGGVHVAKSGTRLASTATTAGLANPVLSITEDVLSLGISLLAVLVPALGFLLALLMFYFGYKAWRRIKRRQPDRR